MLLYRLEIATSKLITAIFKITPDAPCVTQILAFPIIHTFNEPFVLVGDLLPPVTGVVKKFGADGDDVCRSDVHRVKHVGFTGDVIT